MTLRCSSQGGNPKGIATAIGLSVFRSVVGMVLPSPVSRSSMESKTRTEFEIIDGCGRAFFCLRVVVFVSC